MRDIISLFVASVCMLTDDLRVLTFGLALLFLLNIKSLIKKIQNNEGH